MHNKYSVNISYSYVWHTSEQTFQAVTKTPISLAKYLETLSIALPQTFFYLMALKGQKSFNQFPEVKCSEIICTVTKEKKKSKMFPIHFSADKNILTCCSYREMGWIFWIILSHTSFHHCVCSEAKMSLQPNKRLLPQKFLLWFPGGTMLLYSSSNAFLFTKWIFYCRIF